MRTVAERFVFRQAATAQADDRAAGEAEFLSAGVIDGEVAFEADGSIAENGGFDGHRKGW